MVNQFLRPFFEAIYVCPLQEQSSAMFNFVLRMLAFGGATLPERGMRAILYLLALSGFVGVAQRTSRSPEANA